MIRVDGRETAARGTLLEVCRAAGASVPAFCQNDGLSRGGHCRACMVEVDGEPVAACTEEARDGMSVETDTERLRRYRRDLGELVRAESDPAGRVAEVLRAWGVTGKRYTRWRPTGGQDRTHPYLRLDLDRCILCRQCVRACAEIQGEFVFAVTGRGTGARLHWADGAFADSGCVACGACVAACPTEALLDIDRESASPATAQVRTTCGQCGVGCQLEVHVAGDRVARVDGAPAVVNRGHLCVRGRYAQAFARHPERLLAPLLRRNGALVPATWDEALGFVARALARLKGRVGGLASARCTNEESYLFQKWFRAGLGTNDVDGPERLQHAPSAAGMREAFGIGAATNSLADLERADLLLVVGADVTEAQPVTGARIRQAALAGTRLLVVDPRQTELASIADLHLQLRPGADVALLNAIACTLVEAGLVKRDFVAARVEGWEEYEPFIRTQTPEALEPVTGVPAEKVREAAWLFGTAERPMTLHGLGVTQHVQGSEAVMLLCNLALLAGAVGREGVGVNPLRGQSNLQGSADMGCQPDLLPGGQSLDDPAARARFEREWGRPLPAAHGRTLPQMIEAARRGELGGLFVLGEDAALTLPDSTRAREALERLELLVVQDIFMSETAKLAHVVLPGASALEKDGTFTNGERRIQRVRAALPPAPGSRPDWQLLCDLMSATGYPQSYPHPSAILDEIARVVPSHAGLSYARLEGDGLQWPVPEPGHPGTPFLYAEGFPRGKARLSRVEYARSPGLGEGLVLVLGRALDHPDPATMTRQGPDRLQHPADALEIHPRDASARGIAEGDPVIVESAHGRARALARITDRVVRGVVFLTFHRPETGANQVTGQVCDRRTGCPEYKATAVEVTRA